MIDRTLNLCYISLAMSKYIIANNQIRVTPDGAISVVDKIPTGTYIVEEDSHTGELFLSPMSGFTYSGKIYGSVMPTVERIAKTYQDRNNNLGVLLSGIKGSGKSLTIKLLSQKMTETLGIPTIVVSRSFNSNALSRFLYAIDMPCVVFFDEFDKNFSSSSCRGSSNDNEAQNGLLDLLDGVLASQKLFIFCANNKLAINEYMMHRPGRIFYHFKYESLTDGIISEYLDDTLKNPERKREIMVYCKFIPQLTFDVLKAIVEETNRYDEPIHKFIDFMNIDCSFFNSSMAMNVYNSKNELIHSNDRTRVVAGKSYDFWCRDETLLQDAGYTRSEDGDFNVELCFDPAMLKNVNDDGSFTLYDFSKKLTIEFKSTFDDYSTYKHSALGCYLTGEEYGNEELLERRKQMEANNAEKQNLLMAMLNSNPEFAKTFNLNELRIMVNNINVSAKEFAHQIAATARLWNERLETFKAKAERKRRRAMESCDADDDEIEMVEDDIDEPWKN